MLYNPKAFFTHAALLDQGCPHCPKFPTAASRRSLDRVSVPVWLVVLSDQLLIVALVGFYPTNKLIRYRPLHEHEACKHVPHFHPQIVCGISVTFATLSPTPGHVPIYYSPVRHSPPSCLALPFDLHV